MSIRRAIVTLSLALSILQAPHAAQLPAPQNVDARIVKCVRGENIDAALTEAVLSSQAQNIIIEAQPSGSACDLTINIKLPAGISIKGSGAPILKLSRTGTAFVGEKDTRDFHLSDFSIDGSASSTAPVIVLRGSSHGSIKNLTLINPGNGISLLDSSTYIAIKNLISKNSRRHGVTVENSSFNSIENAQLDYQKGFGVILTGKSHDNVIRNVSTKKSGLELVGITHESYKNTVEDSRALHTGDNCYSISGDQNTLKNLEGEFCAGNGITFYGSNNTLDGGDFSNNNQRHNVRTAWTGGVGFVQGFGGVAQNNRVKNIVLNDEQAVPTQQIGILTEPAQYQKWISLTKVRKGEYRFFGSTLFIAETAGVTGTTPPTKEKPNVDGNVTWRYVTSFNGTTEPDFNIVENATIQRSAKAARQDRSNATSNIGTK